MLTMVWARPAGAACEFVVDAAGGGTHVTIQGAIDALPSAGPCRIDVRVGTYPEAITIAGNNASALGEDARVSIVAARGTVLSPPGGHAIAIRDSRLVTIEGFTIAGASDTAIDIDASTDVTIARNDIHNNGTGPRGGGVRVGPDGERIWIANNLVRSNGRNGIEIQVGAGAVYVTNNTILWNGWNGVRIERADTYVLNNLVVGNGTDGGAAGGRWGVSIEVASASASAGGGALAQNVLYRNGVRAPAGSGGDVGGLDEHASSAENLTTSGGGAGVEGCVIAGCAGAPLSMFFPGTGFGPDFRLVANAPAAGKGRGSFVHQGKEWIPAVDFDGALRDRTDAGAGADVGCHQRMRQ